MKLTSSAGESPLIIAQSANASLVLSQSSRRKGSHKEEEPGMVPCLDEFTYYQETRASMYIHIRLKCRTKPNIMRRENKKLVPAKKDLRELGWWGGVLNAWNDG